MNPTVTVTVKPEDEPVTLTEAKTHLRIDHDDEDGLILLWIEAARDYAEKHTGRRLVTQTVQIGLDEFPADDSEIYLSMFGPGDITSVSSITYLDVDGASQTLSSSLYYSRLAANPPFIALNPDEEWPDTEEDRFYPVMITVVVGASRPEVSPMIKAAILLTMSYWDENRGGEAGEDSMARGLPAGAIRLLEMAWTGAYL